MYTLFKVILFGVIGYLGVAMFAPGMSFWAELANVVSAPFILFCQLIPSAIFTGIMSLSEFIDAYVATNPDASYLGWVSLIVSFIALIASIAYYVILFVVVVIMFNKLSDKVYYATTTSEERLREAELSTAYENSPRRQAQQASSDAFWENQTLNIMGLTTNKEIIANDVQANAIVQAINKNR